MRLNTLGETNTLGENNTPGGFCGEEEERREHPTLILATADGKISISNRGEPPSNERETP